MEKKNGTSSIQLNQSQGCSCRLVAEVPTWQAQGPKFASLYKKQINKQKQQQQQTIKHWTTNDPAIILYIYPQNNWHQDLERIFALPSSR